MNCVAHWFGEDFTSLHPLLQTLHLEGGVLSGHVDINIPAGLAGWFGRKLAKKLGIPTHQHTCPMQVHISHSDEGLHWDRAFNLSTWMRSVFRPTGSFKQGYWTETTGFLRLKLTVDINSGAWHWRCIGATLKGIPVPAALLPQTDAYKKIEANRYLFFVGIRLPLLGQVLSYSGTLDMQSHQGSD